jgi:N-acetylglucosamine-6-sulfatase
VSDVSVTKVIVIALGALVATLSASSATFRPSDDRDGRLQNPSGSAAGANEKGRPNIVVVMSDDQAVANMRVMTNVRRLLGRRGTTFQNSFASFPLCCPSRSTFLTGQYAHNHGVLDNQPPGGGYRKLDHSNTLPVWLQRAGYYTG